MKIQTCESCQFFVENVNVEGFDGKCHRFPRVPMYTGNYDRFDQFPYVFKDDWCGEHCPKVQDRELP